MAVKGWFEIPGVVEGQRTFEQQTMGLGLLLDLPMGGASVLDLGCAEGLISLACKERGAGRVDGVDYNKGVIFTARSLAEERGLDVGFYHADLGLDWPAPLADKYDIVLALAIIHKITAPLPFIKKLCARAQKSVIVRLPHGSTGMTKGKHWPYQKCNVPVEMRKHGFELQEETQGPNNERVQYYGAEQA